jgi:hypothetical protein
MQESEINLALFYLYLYDGVIVLGIEQENTERIVRLETLVESQTNFLVRIESKLDVISDKFVTKELFNEITGGIQKQINEIREDKKTSKINFPIWVAIVPSVILVVIEVINLISK